MQYGISNNGAFFDHDWIALRESLDHRSRTPALAERAGRFIRTCPHHPPTVVDLGAGTGSNFRYLRARLGHHSVRWRLLDHDAGLLAECSKLAPGHDEIITEVSDLSSLAESLPRAVDLITASALLDLTSADWIQTLCNAASAARAGVLIALTIDDHIRFSTPDPMDESVFQAISDDQKRDKGFGPALGGLASSCLINALAARGYAILTHPSNWYLGQSDALLAQALIDGWREAAQRQRPHGSWPIRAWAERRKNAMANGKTQLVVGHTDVLGLPPLRPQETRSLPPHHARN